MFKPDIKWIEPKEFKTAMLKEKKRPSFWLTLLPAPPLLFLWYTNQDKNGMPLWVAIFLSLGLGAFLIYGVPWMFYILPTTVGLYKNGIIKQDRQQPAPIEYKKMKEFSILDAGAISILAITNIDETEHLIGMPKNVDESSVKSYLIEKGVALKADPDDGINSVTSLRDSTS